MSIDLSDIINLEAELAIMRGAAQSREWAALQAGMARLLNPLPQFSAMIVVVEGLLASVPMVETVYPDGDMRKTLPRQLLSGVISYGFAPEHLPEGIVADYDRPGTGQFAHAVLELCRAAQKDAAHDVKLAFLVSAAANAIVAEMGAVFYAKNPDLFSRVRDNAIDPDTGEYTDPDAARIPIALWMDDDVAALDTALWMALTDRIEAAYAAL